MSHVAPRPDRAAPRRTGSRAVTTPDEAPEPSIGQLVADASRDVSKLVHNEITLAKSEVKVSVKAGGLGAALFGVAAVLFLLGVIMFSVALAYFISMTGLHLAWCFLLVFLLYAAAAGVLAFIGYRKVRRVRPPQRAIHQAQETKNTLMHRG